MDFKKEAEEVLEKIGVTSPKLQKTVEELLEVAYRAGLSAGYEEDGGLVHTFNPSQG